tara:strand:+ start:702 stop:1463 length:762 start_codon:yes stop_codon:yes gene_type:complete
MPVRGKGGCRRFVVGSHVRTSLLLERAQVLQVPGVDSGERWPEWFAKWSPNGSLWKTPQRSLLEGLDTFSETWPRWGMMRNGVCSERPTLGPLTAGSGSGYWRTPCKEDGGARGPYRDKTKLDAYLAKGHMLNLYEQVAWPHLWPTPRANDAEKRGNINPDDPRNGLPGAVRKLLPTPTVNDAKNSTLPPSQEDRDSIPGYLLSHGEEPGGQLNPDWVEWLMGWPIGWTDLGPLVMDRFQEWQQQHGGFYRIG